MTIKVNPYALSGMEDPNQKVKETETGTASLTSKSNTCSDSNNMLFYCRCGSTSQSTKCGKFLLTWHKAEAECGTG